MTTPDITPELQRRVADALGLQQTWTIGSSRDAAVHHRLDLTTGDAMLALIEAMRARGWRFLISNLQGQPEAIFDQSDDVEWMYYHGLHRAIAPTLPAAVLLAAAKALGVDPPAASDEGGADTLA